MPSDTPFLEAIRANPHDVATRLVYADWLEERGDPRGELIRIEEEMRPLPVFADRFWELKPRRHELRQKSAKSWLEAMRYGTDCPPTFAHVPNGWKEWWRLVRVFTERWHRFLSLPDVGRQTDEVVATEARLGLQLSFSLREWAVFSQDIRTFGVPFELHDVCSGFGLLELRSVTKLKVVSLLDRGGYHWCVRNEDFSVIDPPVYSLPADVNDPYPPPLTLIAENDKPVADTLSSFALLDSLFFVYALGGGGFVVDVEDASGLLGELRSEFPFHFILGKVEIMEMENILAVLIHKSPAATLRIEVHIGRSRESLPGFLWKYGNVGRARHGVFLPEQQ